MKGGTADEEKNNTDSGNSYRCSYLASSEGLRGKKDKCHRQILLDERNS